CVAAESGRAPTDAELSAHARAQLAAYKCPKRVIPIGELPMNAIGKLDRERLRELADRVRGGPGRDPSTPRSSASPRGRGRRTRSRRSSRTRLEPRPTPAAGSP